MGTANRIDDARARRLSRAAGGKTAGLIELGWIDHRRGYRAARSLGVERYPTIMSFCTWFTTSSHNCLDLPL